MAHGKKYLSTEVSVHKLEVQFVADFLEFEQAIDRVSFFLNSMPGSLQPQAAVECALLRASFARVTQSARLAQPIMKRKP